MRCSAFWSLYVFYLLAKRLAQAFSLVCYLQRNSLEGLRAGPRGIQGGYGPSRGSVRRRGPRRQRKNAVTSRLEARRVLADVWQTEREGMITGSVAAGGPLSLFCTESKDTAIFYSTDVKHSFKAISM